MRCLCFALAALVASPAFADPIEYRAARGQLFSDKGRLVEVTDPGGLQPAELAVLKQIGEGLNFYAAIAMSPGDGLATESTIALANFHSVPAAEAAALATCNGLRKAATPCVVVATVRPKGWEPRALELSQQASNALRRDYRKTKKPRAFAVSPTAGSWAIGTGENAQAQATQLCNTRASEADAKAADCAVVIFDP